VLAHAWKVIEEFPIVLIVRKRSWEDPQRFGVTINSGISQERQRGHPVILYSHSKTLS